MLPPAAMVDGGEMVATVMSGGGGASRHSQRFDLDRIGSVGGVPGNAVNLVLRAAGPHLYI